MDINVYKNILKARLVNNKYNTNMLVLLLHFFITWQLGMLLKFQIWWKREVKISDESLKPVRDTLNMRAMRRILKDILVMLPYPKMVKVGYGYGSYAARNEIIFYHCETVMLLREH